MADEPKTKKLKARVVCHQYGQYFRGDLIEVDEKEYRRVGVQVLMTKEDEEAQRRDAEAKRAAHTSATEVDRIASSGWAEKEAEAARIMRARFLEEQKRQRELLLGGT